MNAFNVSTASNHKQRAVSSIWCGDNLSVEDAPFLFEVKDKKGCYHIGTGPWAYIKNLPNFIMKFLDDLSM